MSDVDKDIVKQEAKQKNARAAQAFAAEQARAAKAAKELQQATKARQMAESRKRMEEEKLAASMKPVHALQASVTYKLTPQVTQGLGDAIKHVGKTTRMAAAAAECAGGEGRNVQWVAVSQAVARDCMHRAYPLALQLGYMARIDEPRHRLVFESGGVIDFTWPGKDAA